MVLPEQIVGFPPALLLIGGAILIPWCKGGLKSWLMLMLPILALFILVGSPNGTYWSFQVLEKDLILTRIDSLSRVFAYIFCLVLLLGSIYALREEDDLQYCAAFAYAGGALGVTLAGDVFSLYIFWEVMAVASTFLILARRTKASQAAGIRYILVHVVGGLFLLAGLILYVDRTGSTGFEFIGLKTIDSYLIFVGIAVNAAIPPLHPWLSDAYPEATVPGAVFLSAFTTKSAVYLMARMYPGTELLIWLGAVMTAIPIFYAVLENDIRRVLAYSLINQVGFMMCGIGIGTALAINGTVAHAFCHILYKALLFMAAGSVLQVTGKIRCTDLGGLYKTMPLTCLFCVVGAASISAFPLFSGFVSKSMIISAAAHNKLVIVWLMLQFASAGVFHHAGIKVPYFMFFGHDSGIRAQEPPRNMLVGMGIAAFLCVFLGVYPYPLYAILPYPVDYIPYTGAHVVGQLQLLLFGALAFCLLILSGYYPAEMRAINLDTDWFYRISALRFSRLAEGVLNRMNQGSEHLFVTRLTTRAAAWGERGAAGVLEALMVPFWNLMGLSDQRRQQLNDKLGELIRNGVVPLGISIAAVVFLLSGLYFLQ
ncbi:MAG: Na(+)/H(+) antiporter subunit D [Desulfofustis sp.]|nr:Na(+)/H(+) antiporter subunit D [Desulfofustis sp.]MBT8345775.1 Na(+)/H(+) antiporter subunit D [Desulfofustis sp.]MBT8354174.1 Na(+)/H(+) antiporter subunit D [Desulfofustis sp.]NNF46269.1 Na(+)/H(+) antiporter subunit D [Desulfofustis sp.]NNK12831.1 Na(+)/H(+) antiporter subunit D [Desulfofustis sp.]